MRYFSEPRVVESFFCSDSFRRIVDENLSKQVEEMFREGTRIRYDIREVLHIVNEASRCSCNLWIGIVQLESLEVPDTTD